MEEEVETKFENFSKEEKAIINKYFNSYLGVTFEDFISKFKLNCEKYWTNLFDKIKH